MALPVSKTLTIDKYLTQLKQFKLSLHVTDGHRNDVKERGRGKEETKGDSHVQEMKRPGQTKIKLVRNAN